MNSIQTRKLLLAIFILLISLSCTTTETSINSAVILETKTSTAEFGTVNISPTATKRSTPSIEFTSTPLLEIFEGKTKEFIIEMFQRNGGCELPCLIGVTPNTNAVEVRKFINHFEKLDLSIENPIEGLGIDTTISYKSSNLSIRVIENGNEYNFSGEFYIEENKLSNLVMNSRITKSFDGKVQLLDGDAFYQKLFLHFTLPEILTKYGKPEKILVATFQDHPDYPNASYPFSLVLFYPEKSFLIQYNMRRVKEGGYYLGCPAKSYFDISTWQPQNQTTFEKATEYISSEVGGINSLNISYFKSIEIASELSPDLFYETFKSNNIENCIKTPKDLWIPLE